jgi:ureidoglycolate hydrolase
LLELFDWNYAGNLKDTQGFTTMRYILSMFECKPQDRSKLLNIFSTHKEQFLEDLPELKAHCTHSKGFLEDWC